MNRNTEQTGKVGGGCRFVRAAAVGLLAALWMGSAAWAVPAASETSGTIAKRPTPPAARATEPAVALDVNGIAIDGWTFSRGLEEYLRENGAGTTDTAAARQKYEQWLVEQLLVQSYAQNTGLEYDREFQRRLQSARRRLLYDYIMDREVYSWIRITTDSVKRYYETHPEEFVEPERVQVRHILASTRAGAERARERVLGGEDFAKLAAEVSIHGSKSQGGLMPPFSRGTYQPSFEQAASALKVGELSPVVETDLGFHVIEKTAEKPARVLAYEEVGERIRRMLYERECAQRKADFLETIRRTARVASQKREAVP